MNWGRDESGKKFCFTEPKPTVATTSMQPTPMIVTQRKRISVASRRR